MQRVLRKCAQNLSLCGLLEGGSLTGQEEGTLRPQLGRWPLLPSSRLPSPALLASRVKVSSTRGPGSGLTAPMAGVGSCGPGRAEAEGHVNRGGRAVLFRCSGSWQGQRNPQLVDSQDFPWKRGDGGRQWTTGGPDLPWPPEGDELEMTQKALNLGVQGTLPHTPSLSRGALGLQAACGLCPVPFTGLGKVLLRGSVCGCGQRSPVFHTCPKRDAC